MFTSHWVQERYVEMLGAALSLCKVQLSRADQNHLWATWILLSKVPGVLRRTLVLNLPDTFPCRHTGGRICHGRILAIFVAVCIVSAKCYPKTAGSHMTVALVTHQGAAEGRGQGNLWEISWREITCLRTGGWLLSPFKKGQLMTHLVSPTYLEPPT